MVSLPFIALCIEQFVLRHEIYLHDSISHVSVIKVPGQWPTIGTLHRITVYSKRSLATGDTLCYLKLINPIQ